MTSSFALVDIHGDKPGLDFLAFLHGDREHTVLEVGFDLLGVRGFG